MFPLQARLWPRGWVEVYLYSSMTSAREGGEWSVSRPSHSLPLGKTWYPLCRRLGGPQGRSGQVRKISPPPELDPRNVQPIASHYTNYATQPTNMWHELYKCCVNDKQPTLHLLFFSNKCLIWKHLIVVVEEWQAGDWSAHSWFIVGNVAISPAAIRHFLHFSH